MTMCRTCWSKFTFRPIQRTWSVRIPPILRKKCSELHVYRICLQLFFRNMQHMQFPIPTLYNMKCKITISYFYENSYFHNFGEFFLFSERVTCLWYDSNIVDCRNAKLSLKRPLSLHLYHQDASTGADKTVPKQNRPHIPIFFFYPIMDYLSKPLLTFAGHLICWQFFYFNVRVQNVFVILC